MFCSINGIRGTRKWYIVWVVLTFYIVHSTTKVYSASDINKALHVVQLWRTFGIISNRGMSKWVSLRVTKIKFLISRSRMLITPISMPVTQNNMFIISNMLFIQSASSPIRFRDRNSRHHKSKSGQWCEMSKSGMPNSLWYLIFVMYSLEE